jgi:hypothetical protein
MSARARLPAYLRKRFRYLDVCTARQWRALKRRQFKFVLEALDNYRHGCAFTSPRAYAAFKHMAQAADEVSRELKGDAWTGW